MKKKNAFTLLEIMIVIFLIGLIGSIIGYNMKGSLDEGKAFKTKQAQIRLREIFELELSKGTTAERIKEHPEKVLKAAGIVNNPDKLIKDGWGNKFVIEVIDEDTVRVTSEKYKSYKRSKRALRGREVEEE